MGADTDTACGQQQIGTQCGLQPGGKRLVIIRGNAHIPYFTTPAFQHGGQCRAAAADNLTGFQGTAGCFDLVTGRKNGNDRFPADIHLGHVHRRKQANIPCSQLLVCS